MRSIKAGKIINRKNTIVFKISAIVALILALMILLFLANNAYSYVMARKRVITQQINIMSVAAEQIYADLDSTTRILNEIALDNLGKEAQYLDVNELRKYLAAKDMADMLDTKIFNNPTLECLYFSCPSNMLYLSRFASQIDWRQRFALESYIQNNPDPVNDAVTADWHIVHIGEAYYIAQTYQLNNINIGAMIRLSRYLSLLNNAANGSDFQYLITDNAGLILASKDSGLFAAGRIISNDVPSDRHYFRKYTITSSALDKVSIRISSVTNREKIYYGLESMQYILIMLSVCAVGVVFLCSAYLRRQIVLPITKLYDATKEIEQGNINYRIPEESESEEFGALIHSFNNMTSEIKDLKISSYEERLERQSAELKYLQMQLRPHFYLNAINTISSLSMSKKNKEIQKFVSALSAYLRYLFTDNQKTTTVKSELDHAVSFIRLQQIKYPDMIFYFCDIDDEVKDVPVQKLLFQTFVENIFKHAFDGEAPISIFMKASRREHDGVSFAEITVEDTGFGFPDSILEGNLSADNEKIGIGNIAKTLELTYGRSDLLKLSNNEQGGARIEILLPMKGGPQNDHTDC